MKKSKNNIECEEQICSIINSGLLSAAKKKDDKVCLWCGGKLTNDNESFCSVYCANLCGGEGD